MATRASIILATFAVALTITVPKSDALILRSQRRNFSVSVTLPARFVGPTYQAWPSYDLFSFSHGDEPTACYLQVRFDAYSDEPGDRHSPDDVVVHWNTTPLSKIRAQYKREFQSPQVECLATVTVGGQSVRVHAVYNADGHFYLAEILRAGTVVSFELRSPSRRELERHRQIFLSLVSSIRIHDAT